MLDINGKISQYRQFSDILFILGLAFAAIALFLFFRFKIYRIISRMLGFEAKKENKKFRQKEKQRSQDEIYKEVDEYDGDESDSVEDLSEEVQKGNEETGLLEDTENTGMDIESICSETTKKEPKDEADGLGPQNPKLALTRKVEDDSNVGADYSHGLHIEPSQKVTTKTKAARFANMDEEPEEFAETGLLSKKNSPQKNAGRVIDEEETGILTSKDRDDLEEDETGLLNVEPEAKPEETPNENKIRNGFRVINEIVLFDKGDTMSITHAH